LIYQSTSEVAMSYVPKNPKIKDKNRGKKKRKRKEH
jgi:hypothetical protein